MLNEVGLISGFWHDIYTTLSDFDHKSGAYATITININPTVRLVWISAILLVLGGICCLIARHRESRKIAMSST